MEDYNHINQSIGFYLGHTFRTIKTVLNKLFHDSGFNVTSEQWHVLMSLWAKDGKTQQEINIAVTKEKATVTRLIDGLEKKNLIVRIQDKEDRRKNLIYLTNEGKAVREKLMPIAARTLEVAVEGFTPEEIETFRNMLIRVQNNLKNNTK